MTLNPDDVRLVEVFERHRAQLSEMLRRRMDPSLCRRLDPDDILSEAFLQAKRRWGSFHEGEGMTAYAWLYRIAMDQLIEAWRKQSRVKRDYRVDMPFPEHSSVQLGLRLVNAGTSPSAAAMREEDRLQVRNLLAMMSHEDQEILWMRYFDQLSYPEAAAILEISVTAATLRCARALRRLNDLWTQLISE